MGIALSLRDWIATYPHLPVAKKDFAVDALPSENTAFEAMSIQMSGGEVLEEDIDGGQLIREQFTLLYKMAFTDSSKIKSEMMDALNQIGAWMKNNQPEFGEVEQTQRARLHSQKPNEIIYQATYTIDYNLTP